MRDVHTASALSSTALDFEFLPEHLQAMLADAVDEYVVAIEEGCELHRESFLQKYKPIREQLIAYLEQIDWLHDESRVRSVVHESLTVQSTTGLVYDDFEIESELGRGAMGIVYRAFQKSLQRRVAVKILPFGTILDEQRTQRFWREAKIAGALEHPGIVSVYGFGRHKDVSFYAMTLVEGRSLDRHIHDAATKRNRAVEGNHHREGEATTFLEGPERFGKIASLVADAADAIHAAHSAGVIHRDIKPSNLILDSQGRVKVTDFGLAVDTADLGLTRSGEIVGTIRYMSPEQAAGKRGLVDQRSDIYCLGATLYELLTYRPPFASESLAEVVREKEAGLLTAPRSIDSTIPRALQTITLKAMRADPRDRYQTASEFAEDLRSYILGKRISAVDQSFTELMTDWARRNTGIVLTSIVSLALLFFIAVSFNIAQKSQQIALQRALIDREKNFQSARRAVDQLGIQFAERLELIPEASELRRDLLRSSLSYYAEFLSEAREDSGLAKAVAEAKWKTAQATAGLETLDVAARLYENADKELAELVERYPDLSAIRAEMLSDWAMRYMGRYQGDASQPDLALSILDRMSSDDQRLHGKSRALLKNNRAFVLAALQRTNEAIRSASEAVEILREEREKHDDDEDDRSLCVSMLNLSQALEDAGQTATAYEVAQQCAIFADKPQSERTDTEASQLRAKALATLAALQWKHQGAQAAIPRLQSVVDIHMAQLEAWPNSIEFRWDLAIALNNLGMAISALDAPDDSLIATARKAFERAYAIANAETEADPQNALAAQRAGNIQNNLGMLLRKLGLDGEATDSLRLAEVHILQAAELSPGNEGVSKSLQRIQRNLNDQ
jgi:eukaryotic-like serine/threonine-protein kinase